MKRRSNKKFRSFIATLACEFLTLLWPVVGVSAEEPPLNKFSMTWNRDTFDQGFDSWDETSISASHKFNWGTAVARASRNWKFGDTGTQFELDGYISVREGAYIYVNVGQSSDTTYPVRRYGGEFYQNLPDSWEASLGIRDLIFSKSEVKIYTGTVGKYWGNYYFLLRLNVIPDDAGTSSSFNLQARRYLSDETYFALSAGSGKSYEMLTANSPVVILGSKKVSLEIYERLAELWYGSAGISVIDEEIRSGVYRRDTSYSLGLEKRF